jgi:hypothetical protein
MPAVSKCDRGCGEILFARDLTRRHRTPDGIEHPIINGSIARSTIPSKSSGCSPAVPPSPFSSITNSGGSDPQGIRRPRRSQSSNAFHITGSDGTLLDGESASASISARISAQSSSHGGRVFQCVFVMLAGLAGFGLAGFVFFGRSRRRVRSGSRSKRGRRKIDGGGSLVRARARHVVTCFGVKVKADLCLLQELGPGTW